MVFDFGIFEKARCGERDRRSLDGLVANIVALAEKARREGLLALEEDAESSADRFLALGLRLVVDGVGLDGLDEVLVTSIYASGLRGKALLSRMMIYTGVRGIAAGYSPALLRMMLAAYIGLDAPPSEADEPAGAEAPLLAESEAQS
jgi:flagellar motor component MotA